MNNLKNYSKPVMQMEQFVPQEYVADCWICFLQCMGTPLSTSNPVGQPQTFIFDNPNEAYMGQMIEHGPHPAGTFIVVSDTEPDPSVLAGKIGEFSAVLASESAIKVGPGTFLPNKTGQYTEGYCWESINEPGYNYCFATTIKFEHNGYGNSPNAS